MSKALVTFPGKLGDILWMLPTAREISRQSGEPVDLIIARPFAPIVELLKLQPYIDMVWADPEWDVQNTAPMTPRTPLDRDVPTGYDEVYHLGYEGWPEKALPLETFFRALHQGAVVDDGSASPRMREPWITLPPIHQPTRQDIYLGWTDEWFELKLGVTHVLHNELADSCFDMLTMRGSRWQTSPTPDGYFDRSTAGWLETAKVISASKLYVGCLSAQWVLANALGVPCVAVEPNPHRHNPIFWWDGPIEKDGKPRNRMVLGNDGKPTFDSRAVVQAVKEELARER